MIEKIKSSEGKKKIKEIGAHTAKTMGSLAISAAHAEIAKSSIKLGSDLIFDSNGGIGNKISGSAFIAAGLMNGVLSAYSLSIAGKNAKEIYKKGIKDIFDDIPDIVDIEDEVTAEDLDS